MLAHGPDNCPVGGADAARKVTVGAIVMCLTLISPGLRGRTCQPLLAVPGVIADGQAHHAFSFRAVHLRAPRKPLAAG